jgi:predicted SprT family Zn-dependent metalloprotease
MRKVEVEREVVRLSRLWRVSLADVTIVFSTRFRTSVGSANFRARRVAISASLRGREAREVLCHELAHLAARGLVGTRERHHGPTWRALVTSAGLPARTALKKRDVVPRVTPVVFLHSCPVCDFTRRAKRPVPRWRCADCARAGLGGRLVITKGTT